MMRFNRLDLIRYGHFSDASLEFSGGRRDLHVIHGANEAGKSTARAAVNDLLYGFGQTTDYAFRYEYGELRIGAAMEHDSETLDFVRKKGRKNTILDRGGAPAPAMETALTRALMNTDLEFFTRMFSLDQERLRVGAEQLFGQAGDGDTGLLAAGAGIVDLLERRHALETEADSLWGPREKKSRIYTQAADRLKQAEATMREHRVTGAQWEKLRKDAQDADDVYQSVRKERRDLGADQTRLERIRRVLPFIRQYEQVQADLGALGSVVLLDEDVKSTFDEAVDLIRQSDSGIREQQDRIKETEEKIEATHCDEEVLLRGGDIDQVLERRVRVVEENEEIESLETQLTTDEHALHKLVASLGWEQGEIESLVNQLPSQQDLARAETLRHAYGEKAEKAKSTACRKEDVQDRQQRMQNRLQELGEAADVDGLDALETSLKSDTSPKARLEAAQTSRNDCQKEIDRLLKRLEPTVNEQTLTGLQLPTAHDVDSFDNAISEARTSCDRANQAVVDAEESLRLEQHDYDQSLEVEGLISEEKLTELRQYRDSAWQLIRSQYIEGDPPDPEAVTAFTKGHSNLASAFESTVKDTDEAADQRFEKAEATGQLKAKTLSIRRQSKTLETLREKAQAAQVECERLDSQWQSLWEGAPFDPAPPPVMREWLKLKTQVTDKIQDRAEAVADIDECKSRLESESQALRDALHLAGETSEVVQQEGFSVLMSRAERVLQEERNREQERQTLRRDLNDLRPELEKRQAEAESSKAALDGWLNDWTNAMSRLRLNPHLTVDEAEKVLEALRQLESAADDYRQKEDRIREIKSRRDRFNKSVSELVDAVASDLSECTALSASNQLKARLAQAREARQILDSRAEDLQGAKDRVEELQEEQRQATETLQHLHNAAGTSDRAELAKAIERSDKCRLLEAKREELSESIASQGDGASHTSLMAECAEQTPDKVANDLEEIKDRLDDLEPRITDALEKRNEAQRAFEAVGGGDVYAIAASQRSQALADMREAAETYGKVGTASLLLRWAAQRYRLERLQPLLMRASETFSKLTLGSFRKLLPEFDDDEMHIAGQRKDGQSVRSHRMSEGTQDQLFLALRLASLEEYLDHGTLLPFVADDLFVNFDDDRALAGLEVLTELSAKTQVLFFTHHQHLSELARKATGCDDCVVNLEFSLH